MKSIAKLSAIALPLVLLVGCATCPREVPECADAELRAALERCEAALAAERAKCMNMGGK